ncbi:uncharacterized protein LOC141859086 isoform X1 [Acropora palmata]|uniref:uncharacterized protein LOC141859086 isoform X1 n=2 Tax=Acropora palmata TaxID=6131 RepID=UPI003DA02AE6
MTCIHVYAVSSPFQDSIRGLPMRIWKGATAGAGCFANGQAAHYRIKGIQQFQRKESTVSIIQPVEIDQQPMPVYKSPLGGLLVGFRLGMLFMQPKGSGNPVTVHE